MHQHANPVVVTQRGRRSHRVTRREIPSKSEKVNERSLARLFDTVNDLEEALRSRQKVPKVSPEASPRRGVFREPVPSRSIPVPELVHRAVAGPPPVYPRSIPVPEVVRRNMEEPLFMAVPPPPLHRERVAESSTSITRDGTIVNIVVDAYATLEEDRYTPVPLPLHRVELRRRVEEYINPLRSNDGVNVAPTSLSVLSKTRGAVPPTSIPIEEDEDLEDFNGVHPDEWLSEESSDSSDDYDDHYDTSDYGNDDVYGEEE